MKKGLIYFEKISLYHYPLLWYYAMRGCEIRVFNFSHALGAPLPLWVRALIIRGKIKAINANFNALHGKALDATEDAVNRTRPRGMQRLLAGLYGDGETELIFKKTLVTEIYKCLFINAHLCRNRGDSPTPALFIPDSYVFYRNYLEHNGFKGLKSSKSVRTIRWVQLFLILGRVMERIIWFVAGAALLCAKIPGASSRSMSRRGKEKKKYRFGIALANVHYIKFPGKRAFDFLLNHGEINKGNTVFVVFHDILAKAYPDMDGWVRRRRQEGYQFIVVRGIGCAGDLIDTTRVCASLFRPKDALMAMWGGFRLPPVFIRAFVKSCVLYSRWAPVFEENSIAHYVYSNQEGWSQIALNILLRKNGSRTWNYSSFIGGGLLYAKDPDFSPTRHILWGFLNPDVFLAVNEDGVRYHRLHYQRTREFSVIGNIYSEMIREDMRGTDKQAFLEENFDSQPGAHTRIIAYFDTSFVDDDGIATSYDDGIASYRDMLRLLEENPNLFIIIKPSKKDSYFVSPQSVWSSPRKGRVVLAIRDTLKSHPRVFWAGDAADTTAIMAVSDLVITHCMSSPTAEALGARKRAFWYESYRKHAGILCDRIPGLVIHGYGALQARVQELLYETPDALYDAYLDDCIRGRVESHLDGLGLTRFRNMLVAHPE